MATGFGVLASRVVAGRVRPIDLCAGADNLVRGLAAENATGYVDPGFALDSAWRGALPPDAPFDHVEDVPASELSKLSARGAELAREHGAKGPPTSLLDREVLRVSRAAVSVGIPMRCVFALTAMGFLPANPDLVDDDEVVRVRVLRTWVRIDARFGSVVHRRGEGLRVL